MPPQAALALHVHSGTPSGLALCGRGTFMAGCTLFRVSVRGTGCHGAMPETGVDPINIAAHIYLAKLCSLEKYIVIVENLADSCHILSVGIIGTGFSSGTGILVEYKTSSKISGIALCHNRREVRVKCC